MTVNKPRPYILLDRDGTILVEKNYLASADEIELLPGAVEGLRLLQDAGFELIVVTNQSGIARGKLTLDTLAGIHAELRRRLAAGGVRIDAFYPCPHASRRPLRLPQTAAPPRREGRVRLRLRSPRLVRHRRAASIPARTAERARSWCEPAMGAK